MSVLTSTISFRIVRKKLILKKKKKISLPSKSNSEAYLNVVGNEVPFCELCENGGDNLKLIRGRITSTKLFAEAVTRRCSIMKAVLKNFADFKGKHLCWSLFLIKMQA